jgi:hypothetical protein
VAGAAYALAVFVVWDPQHELWLRILVGAGVMVLTLGIEYFANIRPAKHWEDIYPVILDQFTASFLEFLKTDRKIVPRINIMAPKRTWRCL